MNHTVRLPLVFLLLVQSVLTISCATTGADSANSPPEAAQDVPDVGQMVSDRAETIDQDLTNTVETVKGRDLSLPQRGIFFSLGVQELERTPDSGAQRTGSDSDISNISVGYDQLVSSSWVVGTLLDLSQREALSSSDLEESTNSSDSLSLFLFSNLALNQSFDLSGYIGVGKADTSSKRTTQEGRVLIQDQTTNTAQPLQVVQGEARGESDSDIVSAGLYATHRTVFGGQNTFIVSAEADFSRITTDAFSEQGSTNSELAYRDQSRERMRYILSGGLSRAYSTSVGVLVPTITLAYVRENADNDALIADLVSNPELSVAIDAAPIDSDYGTVDLDLVWVRPRGIQFFGNINSNFGNRFEDSRGASVGARLEF